MFSTAARNATNREREAGPRAESQYDVIVVGAGVAGLEAARSLVQNYGLKVKVLEARHNVGGRIQQDDSFLPGRDLELGAEFIHGDVNPVVELCEAKGWARRQIFTWSHGDGGPAEGPAPDGGVGYYWLGAERKLVRYDDEDPDMKLCNMALWSLGSAEREAAEADPRSLREFLVDEGVPDRMLGLACAGYGNTAGGTADTVPVRRAMRYERQWAWDGSDLDPDFRMEPSFRVLIEHLASGLDVAVSSPVASIAVAPPGARGLAPPPAALAAYAAAQAAALAAEEADNVSSPLALAHGARAADDGGGAPPFGFARLPVGGPPLPEEPAVTVTTRGGAVLRAHRVVVAVPLPVLRDGDIAFAPPLSAKKTAAAASCKFANGVKVVLKFMRRAWPAACHGVVCADSLIPEMWMNSSKGVGGLIQGVKCGWAHVEEDDWAEGGGEDEVTGAGDEAATSPDPTGPAGAAARAAGGGGGGGGPGGPGAPAAVHGLGSSSVGTVSRTILTYAASDPAACEGSTTVDGAGPRSHTEPLPPVEPGVFHVVTGFIMGVRADAMLASFDDAAIIARVLSQLDAMFGMDATGAFASGFVHNWAAEEFIRGAYSTPTYGEVEGVARALKEPHAGAVFFAGEATAGTVEGDLRDEPEHRVHYAPPIVMHGAMQTGAAAACDVARSLGFLVSCVDEREAWAPTYEYAEEGDAKGKGAPGAGAGVGAGGAGEPGEPAGAPRAPTSGSPPTLPPAKVSRAHAATLKCTHVRGTRA